VTYLVTAEPLSEIEGWSLHVHGVGYTTWSAPRLWGSGSVEDRVRNYLGWQGAKDHDTADIVITYEPEGVQ
jgi:hypothetical protein